LNDNLVGVLLIEIEGSIDPVLHPDILSRSRRLPNQLLPQLLAQTADRSDALHKRYARVLRIAVTQQWRRQGLATALLGKVDFSMAKAVDAVGASFAADSHTLAFWKKLGFIEFHRGYRANPRTGRRAVSVLRSMDVTISNTLTRASQISKDNEDARETAFSQTGAPEGVISHAAQSTLSELDKQLLTRFAKGERSQHDTQAALQRLYAVHRKPFLVTPKPAKRYENEMKQFVQQCIDKWD